MRQRPLEESLDELHRTLWGLNEFRAERLGCVASNPLLPPVKNHHEFTRLGESPVPCRRRELLDAELFQRYKRLIGEKPLARLILVVRRLLLKTDKSHRQAHALGVPDGVLQDSGPFFRTRLASHEPIDDPKSMHGRRDLKHARPIIGEIL